MIVLLIILIILLVQIIINQQELDYHLIEQQNKENKVFDINKDSIMYRGIINRLIWFLRALYHNTIGE